MVNYNFQPAKITITPGTKVTWVNKADMQHTSTSGTSCKPDGKWSSGNIDAGKSFSHTFETEGIYPYFCTPHCGQGMTGVVEVKGKKTGSTEPEKKNDGLVAAGPEHQSHMAASKPDESNHQESVKKNDTRSTAGSSSAQVSMVNYNFEPASITIPPGTKVTWTNRTNTTHTSTSGTGCAGDGKWNSGNLGEGESFSYQFDNEGDYNYFCMPHCSMGMAGVVHVVRGAAKPTGTAEEAPPHARKKAPTPGFKSLDIINSPCTYVLGKHVLDFSIFHRFDNLSGPSGGDQTLYGLDNMRDVRIALAYGLTKRITIGLARSKGDWFNTPYQQIKDLYDASVRVRIFKQDSCGSPISLTAFGNTVRSGMYTQEGTGGEGDFRHESDRWSHSAQLMISRDFGKVLTLQLMGAYVRRNWVNCCAGSPDDLDMGAAGIGGRWALTQKLALVAEYYYVISGYHHMNQDIFFNSLAAGLEINTGGHVFHINFSNSTGLIPNTYIPYTTSSVRDNGIRFGFSISRKFNMNNIKRRK